MSLRILWYVISALLIGAHFLRAGSWWMTALCLAAPIAFFYRHRVSLLVLQAFAYGAGGVWLHTAWQLVQMRRAHEQDWALAAAILGAVAAYSVLAGLLLNSRVMRERYPG